MFNNLYFYYELIAIKDNNLLPLFYFIYIYSLFFTYFNNMSLYLLSKNQIKILI